MPPIPIHKNDPITAAKPDGITPQTASSHPTPTRTTPAAAPATTTEFASSPPAPQPGARPLAPTDTAPSSSSSPPAPEPGATPSTGYTATHHVTETRLGGPPPQYAIPPPSEAQLHSRSTTTSTEASKPGPTQLDLGPIPPGPSPYQQEHRGGAVQPLPRSILEGPPGYVQVADNTPYGTGSQQSQHDTAEEGGVGGAAWSILAKAGEALRKGEEAAWRAVRK